MISNIVSYMNNLERLHRSLWKVAVEKTAAIQTNDVETLDTLLQEEQSHVAAIVQLNEAREKAVDAVYAERSGQQASNVTVSMLLQVLDGEERQMLSDCRDALVDAIEQLKHQNDLNQQLTYQSLQFVNLSLNMMRPPQQETLNYSKHEVQGVRPSTTAPSAFNRQA